MGVIGVIGVIRVIGILGVLRVIRILRILRILGVLRVIRTIRILGALRIYKKIRKDISVWKNPSCFFLVRYMVTLSALLCCLSGHFALEGVSVWLCASSAAQ